MVKLKLHALYQLNSMHDNKLTTHAITPTLSLSLTPIHFKIITTLYIAVN